MNTFKVQTPTATNYVLFIGRLCYAVRKQKGGKWAVLSYEFNMVGTDNFTAVIKTDCKTKKEAIELITQLKN
jgi:hypothetical protein